MEASAKHTAAPVTVDWDCGRIMCGDYVLAYIAVGVRRTDMVACVDALAARFNAHPELLDALQSCLHLAERDYSDKQSTEFAAGAHSRLEQVRAALAKARGEA